MPRPKSTTDQTTDTQTEHPAGDRHSDQNALDELQHADDPGDGHATVPEDFDVEAPTEAGGGEPVHRSAGGDLGEGAD